MPRLSPIVPTPVIINRNRTILEAGHSSTVGYLRYGDDLLSDPRPDWGTAINQALAAMPLKEAFKRVVGEGQQVTFEPLSTDNNHTFVYVGGRHYFHLKDFRMEDRYIPSAEKAFLFDPYTIKYEGGSIISPTPATALEVPFEVASAAVAHALGFETD